MIVRQLDMIAALDTTELDRDIYLFPNDSFDVSMPSWQDWQVFRQEWELAPYFALDIETYGKEKNDGLRPREGRVRLIQIGLPSGKIALFDLGGYKDDRSKIWAALMDAGFWQALSQALTGEQLVIGHNLKFDLGFLRAQYGITARNCRDTMLMSQLLWAGLKGYGHSLKVCSKRHLGVDLDKGYQDSDWSWELSNAQLNYAAADVRVLIPLFKAIGKELVDAGLKEQAVIECDALPCFVELEANGMPVDLEMVDSAIQAYQDALEAVSKPFTDRFPSVPYTAASSTLVPLLNEKLGIDIISTEDSELAYYSKHPEIKALQLVRSLKKQIDYLQGIKANTVNGYVSGSYRQQAPTGFGRSTCSGGIRGSKTDGINLQNSPKPCPDPELKRFNLPAIRSCFKARDERSLIIADLSQAHARIATEASQDPNLIASYNRGVDAHLLTASGLDECHRQGWTYNRLAEIYRDPSHPDYKRVKTMRNISKNIYYGSLNSQGSRALMRSAAKGGVPMDEETAKGGLRAWKQAYGVLHRFQRSIVTEANKGITTVNGIEGEWAIVRGLSGRHIYMGIREDFNGKPSVYTPDACAFYWTSTEADVIKYAMSLILAEFDDNPHWDAIFCEMCHDEIGCECDRKYELEVATAVFNAVHKAMGRWIKTIPVDEDGAAPENLICRSWAEK